MKSNNITILQVHPTVEGTRQDGSTYKFTEVEIDVKEIGSMVVTFFDKSATELTELGIQDAAIGSGYVTSYINRRKGQNGREFLSTTTKLNLDTWELANVGLK